MTVQLWIIVALISLVATFEAVHLRDKSEIKNLENKLEIADTEITTQNAAILKAQANEKKIQTLVDLATQKNMALKAETVKSIEQIENAPNIYDCEKATEWGAKQAAIAAGHFQTIK